ncbi:MAG: ArnT family glycosyltransferase [Vicinamibacteria bacterium]
MTARTRGALFAIAGIAALLRFWGLTYGLPHPAARPDEDLVVGKALKISLGEMRDPRDFNYSHGVYYLHAAVLAAYRGVGHVLGVYPDAGSFLDDVFVERPALQYRICRTSTALMGVATTLLAAWAAWEGYRRRSAALLAGLLVAVNFLHVRDSHFGTVDVPMTLFATLSLVFSFRAGRHQLRRDYVLGGLCAGLATSAKYNAVTIVFALAAATLTPLRHGTPPERRRAVGSLALAAAASILAFALTSPYCVLRLPDFLAGVAVQRRELFDGAGEAAWRVHLRLTLPGAFGFIGLAAAAFGIVRSLWLRRPADLIILAFMIPTFASLAEITWVQARYMIPLVPPLAILAAETTAALVPPGPTWMAVATLLLVIEPLRNTIAFDRLAAREDTRLLAASWIDEHLPPHARIAACEGYGAPAINTDKRRPPAFEPLKVPCSVDAIQDTGARYVVTHAHPDIPFFRPSGRILRWLNTHAKPLAVFDPVGNAKGLRHCFFQGDAFYLPYCRFESVERGGPAVTVWDLGWAASPPSDHSARVP